MGESCLHYFENDLFSSSYLAHSSGCTDYSRILKFLLFSLRTHSHLIFATSCLESRCCYIIWQIVRHRTPRHRSSGLFKVTWRRISGSWSEPLRLTRVLCKWSILPSAWHKRRLPGVVCCYSYHYYMNNLKFSHVVLFSLTRVLITHEHSTLLETVGCYP